MRLINVTTTRFEEFPEYGMPRYAILSHTWGRDIEDLTFGELKGCCEQAKRDGFGYVWIDTCCIDKTNLVELSEAINSMFRWYQHAAVCYAYLSDVHDGEDPRAEGSSFRTSRWFSRGWTLQELLAPKRLVFFSTDWHRLGTKVQLRTVVEQITGIPERFLRGSSDISSASVAPRMSWAAQRQTGRPEDIAYCLLGIFGIAMPMIYGEGRDRAFMRLQEHIMRTTSDHSILAWGLGGPTSGSEQAQPGGGILANSPSDFAHSGHIVPQDQRTAYVDQLEISGGSLRVSLSVIATSTETIGLLNCGPEEDSQQSGSPLGSTVTP
ncbi:HET-domain-containing protein [Canariomyces notabilis]|uniref:HET-domain-containing protein n=1 Tax=Canariomyces notabilis TaxID=2074819 RepID=A0AAN6TFC3_9PEZI|nr:HET-domain-containing protein [Canariomyces arenarius]